MESNNIKVSILVPFFNVENYVGKCVESLFTQTYPNIEYIFVNDKSPDRSIDIIKDYIQKYDINEKCTIINHLQNEGIAISRNDCLAHATGDYILFVDSDDYIDKDMVQLMVEKAISHNADVVGCGFYEEYKNKKHAVPQTYSNNKIEILKAITKLTIKGVLWKLLIKNDIIQKNAIAFTPHVNIGEDYVFCCKIFFYAKTVASVDKCLYHYVQYNPNNCSKRDIINIEKQAIAIKEVEDFFISKNLYNIVEKEIKHRKFITKLPLLLDKNCIDTKKWRALFPESNDAWKEMHFSQANKIIFRLAQSPLHPIIKLIRKLK